MRISRVEVLAVAPPVERYRWSDDLPEQFMTNTVVRIEVDTGQFGTGGVWNGTSFEHDRYTAESIRHLAPILIGQDARDIPAIMHLLRPRVWPLPGGALAAINTALWDLAGRDAEQPVYELLGAARHEIHAYASTPMLKDVASYVEFGEQLVAQGYHAIKLHTWCIPEQDVELARVMRHEFGDRVELMLDAENNYDHESALRVAHTLADLDFCWFEAPLPDHDVVGYRQLNQHCGVTVLPSGNWVQDLDTFRQCVATGTWGAARTDVTMLGSLEATRAACDIAAAVNLNCELFSWGYTLIGAANLHVMLSVSNCQYFEQPVPDGAFDYGMLDVIRPNEQGIVQAPDRPGLGFRVDWDAMLDAAIVRVEFS